MRSVPIPRLCVVEKSSAECEYGFNLHAERGKGQFVGAVDIGSPADLSGLRPGDHIIAVNGESIGDLSHKEVVHRIKSNATRCSLLVLDEESVQWFKERNVPLSNEGIGSLAATLSKNGGQITGEEKPQSNEESSSCRSASDASVADPTPFPAAQIIAQSQEEPFPSEYSSPSPLLPVLSSAANFSTATIPRHHQTPIEAPTSAQLKAAGPKPRLCALIKKSPIDEFGFNLHAERGKGHFVGAVDKGGIADDAGLETGQRIVGVNGRLVSAQTPHKEIVKLIKSDPLKTVLLVASEEADRFYAEKGLAFSYDHLLVFDQSPQNGRNWTNSDALKSPSQRPSNMRQRKGFVTEQQQKAFPPPAVAVQIKVRADNRTDIQIKEAFCEQKTNEMAMPKVEHCAEHSPADLFSTDGKQTFGQNESEKRQNGKYVLSGLSPEISPSPYQKMNSSRTNSPEEQKGNFHEIFALSAQEARQRMKGRKRDPRKEGKMTLEEKHRLILNL
ncbi:hypothetical protein niasHS_003495 [Heterodera schachtii]|uniref:PDZ domain-containing protein n=1 Tax=Heterodera schachtii TaxID=97005 RepID=A0ABD2KGQ8_HETSC